MLRTSEVQISYTPRPDATQEAELNALACVYRLILDCRAMKNAAGVPSTNGDAKGSKHDRASRIIPERS